MGPMHTPTSPLAGRYRFSKTIQVTSKSAIWLATDTQSGKPVVASALGASRLAGLDRVVGFEHPHLASLLALVPNPAPSELPWEGAPIQAAAVAIAEFVAGKTLQARLKDAAIESEEAVGWVYGLAEAVGALHAHGGLHGAISPRGVMVEPRGGRIAPVLTQLLTAPNGPYCAPERLRGGGPSAADDTWALAGVLYTALTGAPVFSGTTREELIANMEAGPLPLASFGLDDELLRDLMARALAPEPSRRIVTVEALRDELDDWQRSGRKSQVSVPSLDTPVQSAVDASTDWDDDDEKTTVTSSAVLAAIIEQANRAGSTVAPPPPRDTLPTPAAPPSPESPSLAAPPEPPAPSAPPLSSEETDALSTLLGDHEELEGPTQVLGAEISTLLAGAAAAEPTSDHAGASSMSEPAPRVERTPSLAPPSEPASAGFPEPPARAASVTPPVPPGLESKAPRARGRSGVLAALALVLVGGAAAVYSMRAPGTTLPPAGTSASPAAPPTSASPSGGGDHREGNGHTSGSGPRAPASAVAPAASSSGGTERAPDAAQPLGACVASYFLPGTFSGEENFDFLCQDKDFRGINSQFYRRVVVAGAGKVTPGMREWSGLGWFEMATTAVVRARCCPPTVARPELPEPAGPCPSLAGVLERLPAMVTRERIKEAASAYGDAVTCMYKRGIPRPYSYGKQPIGSNQYLFEQFLTRAAARSPRAE